LLAAVIASSAIGCGLPPNPSRPELLTMAELEALAAPGNEDAKFFPDAGVPGGLRIGDYVKSEGGKYSLTLRTTWAEGMRSAYETAEIWKGFDEVWVQPAYVAITRDANGAPHPVNDAADGEWRPIFSVGPGSSFYSPFWRIFYFEVPDAATAEKYKSARDVIDSGRPLIEGPGHTMSIVPGKPGQDSDIVVPTTMAGSAQRVGGPAGVSAGYLDGEDVSFLDFGESNFAWNDDLVVEETPLFVLLYRDAQGNVRPLNVPTVAGTGPLYAGRAPNVSVDRVPHYGAYWRLYTVIVPSTARIFAPPGFPPAGAPFAADMVGAKYGDTVVDPGNAQDVETYVGRVALNPVESADGSTVGCFDEFDYLFKNSNSGCEWLDSQPALEMAVPPSDIERTDITVTCPFVSYYDVAVKP
jgi:hypothetical protein